MLLTGGGDCPSATLSTAQHTTRICAGRKPNYQTTRRRIPNDSADGVGVSLHVSRTDRGHAASDFVVLTSELKSSASLSLHPRGRSPCCLSEKPVRTFR